MSPRSSPRILLGLSRCETGSSANTTHLSWSSMLSTPSMQKKYDNIVSSKDSSAFCTLDLSAFRTVPFHLFNLFLCLVWRYASTRKVVPTVSFGAALDPLIVNAWTVRILTVLGMGHSNNYATYFCTKEGWNSTGLTSSSSFGSFLYSWGDILH